MTRQVCDTLNYGGEDREINSLPLQPFIDQHSIAETLDRTCSMIWRGYYCHWKMLDGRLLLSEFHGIMKGFRVAVMSDLFPDAQGAVLASWCSGEIVMPEGELISSGMYDTCEYDHVLTISKGEIVSDVLIENTPDRMEEKLQRTISTIKTYIAARQHVTDN